MRSVMEPEPTPPAQMEAPGPAMPPPDEAAALSAADAARAAHDHAAALAAEAAAAQAAVAAAEAAAAAAVPPPPPLNITQTAVPGLFDLPTVGTAAPLGASLTADGVNFAVYAAPEAHAVNLCLFTPEDLKAGKPPTHEIPLDPEANRTGNVWHTHLPKCSDNLLYGYRVDGPKNQHKGQLFDKDLVLLDPYATATLAGDRVKYGVPSSTAKPGEECWPQYAGAVPSRDDVFDWEGVTSPGHAMADLCVYETHVRGLTASQPDGGTYEAVIDKLPYLKRMGFNALELMPIAEFNELEYYSDNPVTGEKRYNFWGYSTVNFFSPKQLFAKSAGEDCGRAANRELKTMVRECHRNGIEVILDVVFNHTAEGNERGLTLSLRGFDNRTYYMVAPEGQFYNYSGCGNTVNCNHPIVRQMIVDCLRHWVTEYHIDGFRFDLASIMTRAPSSWDRLSNEGWPTTGIDNNEISVGDALGDPPVIAMISNDPVLGDVKLIAEAWDAGGLYQVGSFPHYGKWAEWNGRFRDDARNFIRGFDGYAGLFAECICGSPSLYKDTGRKPYHSLNFITAHDGFTLRDLVSYNEKHNDANGENNQDGEENNQSWNCGLGPHEDGDGATPVAKVLRDRQMRNFFAALFVSQGTPMVYQGDEYGHTKGGNNNTYCHDNALNWVDWDAAKDPVKNAGLSRFARLMRQFKARQPALRLMDFPNENNIKWHGNEPNEPSWDEENRFVAFTVQSHDPGREIGLGKSEQIYCAFNAYHLPAKVVLPNPPDGCAWRLVADTALQPPYDFLDADDIPAQSKAAAEAMLKPQLASNCYTVMDRASVIIRAERVKPLPEPEPEPVAAPEPEPVAAAPAADPAMPPAPPAPEAPPAA
jgi:isoamylase